jgi:DNA-binding transcriptional MerR regulator
VTAGVFTIGSVARHLDVPVATIRTWEKRYGGVVPARSDGGHRLYTHEQLEQLRFVARRVSDGTRPAEAFRLLAEPGGDMRTFELELPANPRAPEAVRNAIDDFAAALPDDRRFNLRLLASELVANSVRYGRSPTVRVAARMNAERVQVEISDDGEGFTWGQPGPDSEGGRGLPVVAALADRWGLTFDGGTTAWFELRANC